MEKSIEELLNTDYYIIDILPAQVPEDSPGNFFAVEKYFLDKRRLNAIKQKHINTVLKPACYVNVSLDGEPEEATSPIKIAKAMRERPVFICAGDALN